MNSTSKGSGNKDSASVCSENANSKEIEAETDKDVDALIALLDGYTQAGESRIKLDVVEGEGEVLAHKYHHGRCDVGSPWACGAAFDVLE